jgi:hypothetical protein
LQQLRLIHRRGQRGASALDLGAPGRLPRLERHPGDRERPAVRDDARGVLKGYE